MVSEEELPTNRFRAKGNVDQRGNGYFLIHTEETT